MARLLGAYGHVYGNPRDGGYSPIWRNGHVNARTLAIGESVQLRRGVVAEHGTGARTKHGRP